MLTDSMAWTSTALFQGGVVKSIGGHDGSVMMSDRSMFDMVRTTATVTNVLQQVQRISVTLTCSFRRAAMLNSSYSFQPRSSSVLSLEESHGQNSGVFLLPATGGNW